MAGIKIDNFSTSDVNLTEIMTTAQAMRNGHFALSLTEMDSTTIPEIAAGSIIDLNGTLIYFDSDETIGGTPVDGVTYIKLIYSSGTITAEWTATAPVFEPTKNGWYGISTNSSHRYVAKMIKATASYTGKILYDSINIPPVYETQLSNYTGSWTSGATKTATLTYATNVKSIKTLSINAMITSIDSTSTDSITISGNTISIVLNNRGTSATYSHYSILCVAEIS